MINDKMRIVVVGTLASNPYAGMAWMHMQLTAGLHQLGHDVYYFETTSNWPYDPVRQQKVRDSNYAVPYLERVAEGFGLKDRWAYRRSFSDKEWLGLSKFQAEETLATSDLVLNVTGATKIREENLPAPRLVYFGTDPVYHEITYAAGDSETIAIVDEHQDCVTYGENIGTPRCPVPPLPRLRARTRQPVLMDLWDFSAPARDQFTTVGNWKQEGREVTFQGDLYQWSKHHEFLKYLNIPRLVEEPIELATNVSRPETIRYGRGEPVRAWGLPDEAHILLDTNGWQLKDAREFTLDPWSYRDYVQDSRGEFTVARDLNVRLRSGWFSERSACYLAAGRPVITQDTGFGDFLPTGEGLFAFQTQEEVVAAFDAIRCDYARHSSAARAIAAEYFAAEKVLPQLLEDLT